MVTLSPTGLPALPNIGPPGLPRPRNKPTPLAPAPVVPSQNQQFIQAGNAPPAFQAPATPLVLAPQAPIAPTVSPATQGVSIVDFLKSQGQPSDFNSRAILARDAGIQNFIGTAEQNTELLGILRDETAPVAPAGGPAVPEVAGPKTSDGRPINADTGGVIEPPPAPDVSQATQDRVTAAETAFQASQGLSAEQIANQEAQNQIAAGLQSGLAKTADQPIPLPFITGQQASQQRSALALQTPLIQQAAILQAKRMSALEASRFALERADVAVAGERAEARESRQFAESQRRFAIEVGLDERKLALSEKTASQSFLLSERKFNEDKRRFGLQFSLEQQKFALSQVKFAQEIEEQGPSAYKLETANTMIRVVDDLIGRTNERTVRFGALAKGIPGSAALNYASDLKTLQASVAFGALTAMREASKTGGALGQVSERELALLESTLASMEQRQTPKQMKKNLNTIRDSAQRWVDSAVEAGVIGGGDDIESARGQLLSGEILVRDKASGQIGGISPGEFNASTFEKL